MAIKYFWLGSRGPYGYDDAASYLGEHNPTFTLLGFFTDGGGYFGVDLEVGNDLTVGGLIYGDLALTTSAFNRFLSSAEDTAQKAFDYLDNNIPEPIQNFTVHFLGRVVAGRMFRLYPKNVTRITTWTVFGVSVIGCQKGNGTANETKIGVNKVGWDNGTGLFLTIAGSETEKDVEAAGFDITPGSDTLYVYVKQDYGEHIDLQVVVTMKGKFA